MMVCAVVEESMATGRDADNSWQEEDLPPIRVEPRLASPTSSFSSAGHTLFAVPLEPHQLLPPDARPPPPVMSSGVQDGPKTVAETLLEGLLSTPTPSILGPRSVTLAPVRRRKALPPNFTPRRSARISQLNGDMNVGLVQHAQTMLLRRMGVIQAKEQLSQEALDAYLKLFDKPLTPHHIKVVAALFDPEGPSLMNLLMRGLLLFHCRSVWIRVEPSALPVHC